MWLEATVLGMGALVLARLAWDCLRWGITPMPTYGEAQRRCLQLMAEQPTCGLVIDAGAGFGTMACAMARRLPQAQVVGIEGSQFSHTLARLIGMAQGAHVQWLCGDIFAFDTQRCIGVFCYLYPAAMGRLASHLRTALPPNGWVVSHAFALPGWHPDLVVRTQGLFAAPIYLYRRSSQPPTPQHS